MMKYDKNGELYAEIDYNKCIFCNKCITACPYSVAKLKIPSAYLELEREINKFNQ
jgi:Fe-S-cluster-containing dehydrogenase component